MDIFPCFPDGFPSADYTFLAGLNPDAAPYDKEQDTRQYGSLTLVRSYVQTLGMHAGLPDNLCHRLPSTVIFGKRNDPGSPLSPHYFVVHRFMELPIVTKILSVLPSQKKALDDAASKPEIVNKILKPLAEKVDQQRSSLKSRTLIQAVDQLWQRIRPSPFPVMPVSAQFGALCFFYYWSTKNMDFKPDQACMAILTGKLFSNFDPLLVACFAHMQRNKPSVALAEEKSFFGPFWEHYFSKTIALARASYELSVLEEAQRKKDAAKAATPYAGGILRLREKHGIQKDEEKSRTGQNADGVTPPNDQKGPKGMPSP